MRCSTDMQGFRCRDLLCPVRHAQAAEGLDRVTQQLHQHGTPSPHAACQQSVALTHSCCPFLEKNHPESALPLVLVTPAERSGAASAPGWPH